VIDRLPGGLSARRFLGEYWQKRPLLIRGALPDTGTLPARERLLALARNAEVESRLVLERGGDYPWQVRHGPFTGTALRRLPPSHWSLLVQGVNFHDAAASALLDRFAFVPNWRVDDVMMSLAPDRGSVGPHLDSYDVFLLQTAGRRRWRIAAARYGEADLVPGLDLRILRDFRATQEWVLEPGDMLYVPPGVAHHGIAIGHSITCSVGFRAPSGLELLGALLDDPPLADRRLADPDLRRLAHPGEVTRTQLRRLRGLLRDALPRGAALDRWLARHLTTLPAAVPAPPPGPALTRRALERRLARGATLVRAPAARGAFVRGRAGQAWLYLNGGEYACSAALAARITGPGPVAWRPQRGPAMRREAQLLLALIRAGVLVLHD
jgi:50S ribosomal protein L16 3-hydroxylase